MYNFLKAFLVLMKLLYLFQVFLRKQVYYTKKCVVEGTFQN